MIALQCLKKLSIQTETKVPYNYTSYAMDKDQSWPLSSLSLEESVTEGSSLWSRYAKRRLQLFVSFHGARIQRRICLLVAYWNSVLLQRLKSSRDFQEDYNKKRVEEEEHTELFLTVGLTKVKETDENS